jgi:Na+-translocating ferredoxin:NAD+ oxidoreductase RnfG subunit
MTKLTFLIVTSISLLLGEPIAKLESKEIQREIRKQWNVADFQAIKMNLSEMDKPLTNQNFGAFYKLSNSNVSQPKGYFYIGRVFTCRQGSCSNNVSKSEFFDYIVFYNTNKSIERVKVISYKASRGHQMTSSGWLRQFKSYDGSRALTIGKDIDAISGATVSVNAINDDIIRVTRQLLRIE